MFSTWRKRLGRKWFGIAGGPYHQLATGVSAFAESGAGAVYELLANGELDRDTVGVSRTALASNVQSFAMLPGGYDFTYLTTSGDRYQYNNGHPILLNKPPAVVAQLGNQGVWEIDHSQGTKVQLTSANATILTADPQGDVVAEFPNNGVWEYKPGGGWTQLNGIDATLLAMDAQGDVVAEFSGYGVGEYSPAGGWRSLNGGQRHTAGHGRARRRGGRIPRLWRLEVHPGRRLGTAQRRGRHAPGDELAGLCRGELCRLRRGGIPVGNRLAAPQRHAG
jgi:hypothetical protein